MIKLIKEENKVNAMMIVEKKAGNLALMLEWQDDKDVVMAAVKKSPSAVKYASDRLKNDKDIAIIIAKNQPNLIQLMSLELRNDEEILRTIAGENIEKYSSNIVSANKELIIELVAKKRGVFSVLTDDWKDDKDVVMSALIKTGHNLPFVSERLRDDKEVFFRAVSRKIVNYSQDLQPLTKQMVLSIIAKNSNYLELLNKKWQDDKDVVLKAVEKFGLALEFASPRLKNDREIVTKAIEDYPRALSEASEELTNDDELREKAFKLRGRAFIVNKNAFTKFEKLLDKIDADVCRKAEKELKSNPKFASLFMKEDNYEILKETNKAFSSYADDIEAEYLKKHPLYKKYREVIDANMHKSLSSQDVRKYENMLLGISDKTQEQLIGD